jgi:hypothetical protein
MKPASWLRLQAYTYASADTAYACSRCCTGCECGCGDHRPGVNKGKEGAKLPAVCQCTAAPTLCLLHIACRARSLPQPHLDRTKLCELNDSQLDQRYVTQRNGLRQVVEDRTRAKVVGGQQLTGKTLARLLQSLITALNAKEIPTGASLIESFNREIVTKALQLYVLSLDAALQLPVDSEALEQVSVGGRELRGNFQGLGFSRHIVVHS